MEQRKNTNDAVVMDAQIKLRREEFALSTGQRLNTNGVALKDAQVLLRREECV